VRLLSIAFFSSGGGSNDFLSRDFALNGR